MNEILESYIEDLRDSLLLFNEALMLLDQGVTDEETINRVFRVAHTIKGNSAAMEFFKVEKVMHTMEDILSEVREHTRDLTHDLVEVQYKCHDFLEDFLEILLETGNDEKVQTDELLATLLKIKGENDPEVSAQKNIKSEYNFADEAFSKINSETFDIIETNLNKGMSLYQIVINFKDEVQMKSIRAFLIFQKIEASSLIVYSEPEAPTEEGFSNGEFECDSEDLKIMAIGDHDIQFLIEDLEDDFSIEDVEVINFEKNQIQQKYKNFGAKTEIIQIIKSIEIDVLDVQKSEINSDIVKTILDKLKTVSEKAVAIKNDVLDNIAKRLIKILRGASLGKKSFSPDDVQVVTVLLKDITDAVEQDNIKDNKQLLNQIERDINLLEENISKKGERTGDILKAKGLLNDDDIDDIISKQKEGKKGLKFGQVAVKENKVSAVEMSEALKEQQKPVKETVGKSSDSSRQIRISVNKVDNLLDMLGELTILNSQLGQQLETDNEANPEIANTISRTSKIIRSVQDLSMSMRLIQIKNTLFRLTRIIRDTASELGKKVNIVITGDEIEIDRSAAEKIFDPLMHLVRNAVSHGIETPAERIKAGKDPEGKIEINAYSKRGSVFVEIKDNGKGINPDKVLEKAISLGMADEETEYTDEEKIRFIMEPGFSTQKEVNNISGRGVGMNVVESELMKIGGKVEIISVYGEGSTFVLRIPMNLALLNGTIADISGEQYIIPTLFIKQFHIKDEKDWISMQGKKRAIKIRDNIIPIISEEKIFNRERQNEIERKQIIILEMEKNLLGLPVDSIVGRQEIVSKPLDSDLSKAQVLAGASILGDGRVSLILDVEAIFKIAGF